MMMRAAVDRRAATRGGLATSVGIHVILLLVIAIGLRSAGQMEDVAQELTKISYIEAHLGEDIEKKVALKTLAKRTPPAIESGRGISTRSAQKPKTPTESPTPPRREPVQKTVADVAPDVPKPSEIVAKQPTQAPRLDSRDDAMRARLDVPTSRDRSVDVAADADGPSLTSKSGPVPDMATAGGQLENRRSTLDVLGGDIDPSSTSGQRGGSDIADAGSTALSGGGALQSRGGGNTGYTAPGASLKSSGRGGRGIADAGGADIAPPSGGGSEGSGRRTILDYGSGGGSGGGLRSRGGIAPAPDAAIQPKSSSPSDGGVAEAAPTEIQQNGMGMTISGQIAGREIVKVVSPEYTAQARRMGWEGIVAVHFTVLPDGRVKDNTRIQQMSAHGDLNKAALAAIRKFRFAPLDAGKAQVEQWGVITFVFRLK